MVERHAKAAPAVVGHDILSVVRCLQATYVSITDVTEILQAASEAGGLHYAYHRVLTAIPIDIACLKTIDRVRQTPIVQPVEAVVLLAQLVRLRLTLSCAQHQ